jgi:DNA-binding winged helix-turn-helix (wHTH) protein
MTVRKALGESGWAQRCIQTIHWRRYCFVEDVLPLKRLTTHSKNPVVSTLAHVSAQILSFL